MLLQSKGLLSNVKRAAWVQYSALDLTSRSNIVEETVTPAMAGKNAEMQNYVFVLDTNTQPLSPCHPARGRELLRKGKASIYRHYPFTIILNEAKPDPQPAPIQLKIDPGSKTTGMALVQAPKRFPKVIWAAELEHRGQIIKTTLEKRKAIRRGRRARNTRYRKPSFQANNQATTSRPEGWLAPSLKSRVGNLQTWFVKLYKFAPIKSISIELVRFDTQLMQDAEISGIEYQQGELQGYEVREYLLEKWQRKCAYCEAKDVPLEIEHITPKSKGGSNRVSNLTLACHECNQKKGNQTAAEFGYLEIQVKAKQPLKDAAAVNVTRWAVWRIFDATGLPVEVGTGGRTKFNRVSQHYPKAHWIDATCVGVSGKPVLLCVDHQPLLIKATGRGSRQLVNSDKYGFPRGKAKAAKCVQGFQTGDMVIAIVPKGKYAGVHKGKVNVRSNGNFKINGIDINRRHCRVVQRVDGYNYQYR